MTRPRNTRDEIIPIPALHGVHQPGAIEAQEAAGGAAMAADDCEVIPVQIMGGVGADLIALGFVLGDVDPNDALFRAATLPPGWKRAGTDHSMNTSIVDELGRKRVGIFYKAAWYDRSAHLSIESVHSYVWRCVYADTAPVLDDSWATREAVLTALDSLQNEAHESAKTWAACTEDYARTYESEAHAKLTKIAAMRETLGGAA